MDLRLQHENLTDFLYLGRFPIDAIFSVFREESGRNIAWEDDLDVARLLVENGGASDWNISIVIGLSYNFSGWDETLIPPALEYLLKQDCLPFDLNHPLNGFGRHGSALTMLCCVPWAKAGSLKALLACNVDPSLRDIDGNTALHLKIQVNMKKVFSHEGFQRHEFDRLVQDLCILLDHKADPNALNDSGLSPGDYASLDPQFANVAWKLALELSGCITVSSADTDELTEDINEGINHGEYDKAATTTTTITTTSTTTIEQRIPGAWTDDDREFPIIRQFTSVPEDYYLNIVTLRSHVRENFERLAIGHARYWTLVRNIRQ